MRRLRKRLGLGTASVLERQAAKTKRDSFVNSRSIERQKKSFDSLVDSGIYDADFEHAAAAKSFVGAVLKQAIPRLRRRRSLNCSTVVAGRVHGLHFFTRQLTAVGIDASSALRVRSF